MPLTEPSNLHINCTLAPQVNLAFHQNAVPLIRDLVIINTSEQDYTDLRLHLEAAPAYVKEKSWLIDDLPAGATLQVTDRDTLLDGQFLFGLQEALRGHVTLTLLQTDVTLATHTHELEVLARNEWGGYGASPELLAAFSMPNDAVVDNLLHAASDVLRRSNLDPVIDGYRAQNRKRVWEQAAAIWTAVSDLHIEYAYPPASFERTGQKVRTPSMIYESRRATCLDTTLLFTAALEQAGLNGVIVIKKGHAYAGFWYQPEGFTQVLVDDVTAVRKRIDLQELVLFETTLSTRTSPAAFSEAVRRGRAQVDEGESDNFEYLLDLSRARAARIRPMDYAQVKEGPSAPIERSESAAPIDAPPENLPDWDDITAQEAPATPQGRLEYWQRKLLDLTLRNRLLNFKPGRSTVTLVAPDPTSLEDRLADHVEMQILPLPEFTTPTGRDARLHEERMGELLDEEYAQEGLQRNRIYVRADKEELEKRLVTLFRAAKTDLEEGGSNTLYLVAGFLRWQRAGQRDDRVFQAPLIMIPIEIKRRSVRSGFRIKLHDDEPRFNSTLLEMLRQDFQLDIQGLDGALPTDEAGVDVRGIWDRMRREVRDISGFEVTQEVVLGRFSFAKYLMWKDLVDRTDQLKNNRVVKHLLETPKQAFATDLVFPNPCTLDDQYQPAEVFTPLDSDSSQLTAVLASAEGKDFVMVGPPGTGKSQTIANMIAHNLGIGRTVLFVSEKVAALNVVYRRLKEVGLGEFCLELHSNKARKVDVLKQLRAAWELNASLSTAEWQKTAEQIQKTREHLNTYVARLHHTHRNGWSLHRALGQIVSKPQVPDISFAWVSADTHDADEFAQLQAVARRLGINAKGVGYPIAEHPLSAVQHPDWSLAWQTEIVDGAKQVVAQIVQVRQAVNLLAMRLDVQLGTLSVKQLGSLAQLCAALARAAGRKVAFAFAADGQDILDAGYAVLDLLQQYHQLQQQLSCPYADEAWRSLDVNTLTLSWQEAKSTWWPRSVLRQAAVIKALQRGGQTAKKPNPEQDLALLAQLTKLGGQIEAHAELMQSVAEWRSFETDPVALQQDLDTGRMLRESSAGLAQTPTELVQLRQQLAVLLVESNDLLGAEATIGQAAAQVQQGVEALEHSAAEFAQLAAYADELLVDAPDYLTALEHICQNVTQHHTQLNAWCAWLRARNQAAGLGLQPLVAAVEQQLVATDDVERSFTVAYCRWWAGKALDNDDLLRQFVPAEHEALITRFQQLDDESRALAVQLVRAKLCGQLPEQDDVSRKSEFGILKRELEKKRRHKPLRQLIAELSTALPKLTPCLLMSPLSVAQYLTAEHHHFDVVIFDEASQITVADAIGAIARGKQTIVAGDPKQLPPTSFFARSAPDDETEYEVEDLESILDEMSGAGIPALNLAWHYRSENESLITFSNHSYYGGELITFPAARIADDAVKFCYVTGIYDRGGSRTNQVEAQAVVDAIVARLKVAAETQGTGATASLGVVTFNTEQQTLIENLLDQARLENPVLEPYFGENVLEPVFVKNLESVQGDERDIIFFSTTYGPDHNGKITMNFGPLNQDGGQRRLNVAVTRARSEMIVYSSIKGEQLDLSRTSALGVRDLKQFLEFAERGTQVFSTSTGNLGTSIDAPFEETVAEALRQRGWQIHLHVGVSTFRVDLGVVHPDAPDRYLAGVACDGATYRQAATARDRDKVRSAILHRLGWHLIRLWATDFWLNPTGAIDKIEATLRVLLEQDRQTAAQAASQVSTQAGESNAAPTTAEAETAAGSDTSGTLASSEPEIVEPLVADVSTDHHLIAGQDRRGTTDLLFSEYHMTDLDTLAAAVDGEDFFVASSSMALDEIIEVIIDTEGPILEANLVKRVAAVYGFGRAGSRIRERVLQRVRKKYPVTREAVGRFFWPAPIDPKTWAQCRLPATDLDIRAPDEIPMEELVVLAAECRFDADPALAMARRLGVSRLSAVQRTRLELALQKELG